MPVRPVVVVYSEDGRHELGRGPSDQELGDHPLTITHYNGEGGVHVGHDYPLASSLNAGKKVPYTVKDVVDEYEFTFY